MGWQENAKALVSIDLEKKVSVAMALQLESAGWGASAAMREP